MIKIHSCRIYASINGRHKFKKPVSFFIIFGHDFTVAHEFHQTLSLNDVHINLEQKQLTTPDRINNRNLQPNI